ncbi:glycerol-3-phosphate 1-O-acyltransferase PlsY [Pelomonas sp. SE-A7]|uniref:glycerol-3-phosphate 1-O-acyltransferase PlsY n=1 Tax=Pelomonas sp. SE-A7 TaxID=3054953 RepID=UPI00259CD8E3|nr:glycerol-3-phosphate 1-O-acyltransferase PlsY [Pelomonas sp. SE-A7]MDM4767254.1 glycerol-3-phosphate 1-O-acyltransferase PlsY [Pelomonas sp. SE-A7]
MQNTLSPLLAALAAYLIGSLSFAVIVSKFMGLSDPRSYGSGNPGATNVLRSGNKVAAILTLVFDALKGYLPVLATVIWGERFGLGEDAPALVGLAAFLGHLWPVFFRFQGGKGVATAAGVLLAINPLLGAATLLTWAIIAWFSRYSSLAAIVSAVFAPFYQMLIWGASPTVLAILVLSLLLVWRHAANIQKLLNGTESKLGQKATAAAAAPASGTSKKHPHGQGYEARGHSHHHAKKGKSKP